jgi:2-oxoisovalerate dehydrogenase E1 component
VSRQPPGIADLSGPGPGEELIEHLDHTLDELGRTLPADQPDRALAADLLALFDAQAGSRWLDVAARRMRAAGLGFYTIGSSGHEGNAAVALALQADDPALLHYRSGAFYLARAAQAGRREGIMDVALGLSASSEEPIAGGRHKVFGHADLAVIPQTSTIASHLPRAVGIAWALGRQAGLPARLHRPLRWPDDAVVVASFGDASANHSTATGAVNAACWAAFRGIPMPLLLVCEDNGLGVSVPTPSGWVRALYEGRSGLVYRYADSTEPVALLDAAREAAKQARTERGPVLLHLSCVRIGGHAGSDVESGYRGRAEIGSDLVSDPLAATMRALVATGTLTPEEVRTRYEVARDVVADAAVRAVRRPQLISTEQVIAPLAPRRPDEVARQASGCAPDAERERVFGGRLPEAEPPLTLAQSINRALLDAGALNPRLLLLGEDVARKGGVYGVTRGLQRRLGSARVVDTLLDEQSVLGLGLGAAISGLMPVPEIQYLAYLHNAEDQIRGEAATLQFFSSGAFRNPMVVRVPGLAYQKGFGGHFHNDNGLAVLRDIPGVVVACPAHPSDAAPLLRTCLAAAEVDGTVSLYLEPIALYHERDMIEAGDGAWTASYLPPASWGIGHAPIGRATVWGTGSDLTIASFGNGLRMSLRTASRLADAGIGCRVVDLRWLVPLPVEDVVREAVATGRLLIVDETRRSGGISEGLVTAVLEAGFPGRLARVAAEDSFVPLGEAAALVLVSEEAIDRAARLLLEGHD